MNEGGIQFFGYSVCLCLFLSWWLYGFVFMFVFSFRMSSSLLCLCMTVCVSVSVVGLQCVNVRASDLRFMNVNQGGSDVLLLVLHLAWSYFSLDSSGKYANPEELRLGVGAVVKATATGETQAPGQSNHPLPVDRLWVVEFLGLGVVGTETAAAGHSQTLR